MADTTGISWCDMTFNPWVGCEKVSPGCANCYAETLVTGRMGRAGTWGKDGVRERTSAANWRKPLAWAKTKPEELGRRPRVFCASLADVFEPRPELDPWRADLFKLIDATPELDWLLLTKRPDRILDYGMVFTANMWIGTSIENARHNFRADILRELPAAIRFISAEPLLGSLMHSDHAPLNLDGIEWVIVGGESGGRHARPMHPDWPRELLVASLSRDPHHPMNPWPHRPAFHFKQWGSWSAGWPYDEEDEGERSRRVTFKGHRDAEMRYCGPQPTAGGHMLDGQSWREFPQPLIPIGGLRA